MCYALSSVADVDLFRQVGVSAITDGPASCAACAGCAWSAGIEDEAAEWSDWTDSVEHAAYMHSASGGGGGGGVPSHSGGCFWRVTGASVCHTAVN